MILAEILKNKEEELEERKRHFNYQDLLEKGITNFPVRSLEDALVKDGLGLIAEIKKASPSAGVICAGLVPDDLAGVYEQAGAAAISVLTDKKFFQGSLDDLTAVRLRAEVPVLRKDFIFDEYQVVESRVFGADAVLLIARILTAERLHHLYVLARQLDLAVLVEVHDKNDLIKALNAGASIIGINNRDLDTLTTDLSTTEKLIKEIPEGKIIVSESGINTKEEVKQLKDLGVNAILVGEALIRSPDIETKVRELIEN